MSPCPISTWVHLPSPSSSHTISTVVGGKVECLCPSSEVTLCLHVMLWKWLGLSLTWLLNLLHRDGSTCLIGYHVPCEELSPTIQEPENSALTLWDSCPIRGPCDPKHRNVSTDHLGESFRKRMLVAGGAGQQGQVRAARNNLNLRSEEPEMGAGRTGEDEPSWPREQQVWRPQRGEELRNWELPDQVLVR